MGYLPKTIIGKVNADVLTDEDVKKGCINEIEINACKEFYKKLNGLEILVELWDYDNYDSFHLAGHRPEDDETVMEAFWILEDVFGSLERAEFINQWKKQEYDSGGVTVFPLKCIEEIRVIREEQKE